MLHTIWPVLVVIFTKDQEYIRRGYLKMLQSAAIVTKKGDVLIAKQYVDMTKSKVEGLLIAFTRLITKDKQHTFIETEEVRYVYQALNNLYCVLITDKQSNMLEDIETLRIFVRVINEYASTAGGKTGVSDEAAIIKNRFTLLFALDEMVQMGYRQNTAQLRTYMDMDSHEERIYLNMRLNQEREAKDRAREKAKEIKALKRSQELGHNLKPLSSLMSTSNNPNTFEGFKAEPSIEEVQQKPVKPTRSGGKAMKLGPSKR